MKLSAEEFYQLVDFIVGGIKPEYRGKIKEIAERYLSGDNVGENLFEDLLEQIANVIPESYAGIKESIRSFLKVKKDFYNFMSDEYEAMKELANKKPQDLIPALEIYQKREVPKFIKQKYVDVARVFLGLQADATIDRMTPKAMREIDLFLADCSICTQKIDDVARAMVLTALANPITYPFLTYVKEGIDFLRDCEKKYQEIKRKVRIYPTCYALNKRNYSQSLQWIFFNE